MNKRRDKLYDRYAAVLSRMGDILDESEKHGCWSDVFASEYSVLEEEELALSKLCGKCFDLNITVCGEG